MCGLQIGALWAKQKKKRSRAIFLRVLCREKGRAFTRVAFYDFPHACISHSHVSTNIPRKLGGMKSFAPFWLSRRHDERFVEPTRKIFSSYRGWGRGGRETPATKNISVYKLPRASKSNSSNIWWTLLSQDLHFFREKDDYLTFVYTDILTYVILLHKFDTYWWLLLRFHFFKTV